MPAHPELAAEQAYVDHAYLCLEEMRRVVGRGGDRRGRGGRARGVEREPARHLQDAESERIEGLRALYVALTRATKTLVVVHAEPLPRELGLRP